MLREEGIRCYWGNQMVETQLWGSIEEGLPKKGTSKERLKVNKLSQTAGVWVYAQRTRSCVTWHRAVEFEVISL